MIHDDMICKYGTKTKDKNQKNKEKKQNYDTKNQNSPN